MASKLNVERLFALPYSQLAFEQIVKPMSDHINQLISASNDVDPQLIIKITEGTIKYIHQGAMQVIQNFYIDVLTDEDVDFLREIYQHPTLLKLQSKTHLAFPLMTTWFEENEEIISRHIEAALEENS